jgi:hypothetical protein
LGRSAFEVEGPRQPARVQGIVRDRHLLVGDALADPACEIAALLQEGEPVEGVEGEIVEQVGDRVRLEHGADDSRLEIGGVARAAALLDRLVRGRRRIEIGDAPARGRRVARCALVGREHEHRGVGRPLRDTEPCRRCDRQLGDRAREVAVEA